MILSPGRIGQGAVGLVAATEAREGSPMGQEPEPDTDRTRRCRRTDANNEIVGSGFGDALARVLSQCRNESIAAVDNDLVAVSRFPAVPDGFHG
jgi:hypothetical protein